MSTMPVVFEHDIDLTMYLEAGLTVQVLWEQIEAFARQPHAFVSTMRSSKVREVASDTGQCLQRTIDFENFSFEDVVLLHAPDRMRTVVPATGTIAASSFEIRLMHTSTTLGLHFCYAQEAVADVSDNASLRQLQFQAWAMKDRDVVRTMLARALR